MATHDEQPQDERSREFWNRIATQVTDCAPQWMLERRPDWRSQIRHEQVTYEHARYPTFSTPLQAPLQSPIDRYAAVAEDRLRTHLDRLRADVLQNLSVPVSLLHPQAFNQVTLDAIRRFDGEERQAAESIVGPVPAALLDPHGNPVRDNYAEGTVVRALSDARRAQRPGDFHSQVYGQWSGADWSRFGGDREVARADEVPVMHNRTEQQTLRTFQSALQRYTEEQNRNGDLFGPSANSAPANISFAVTQNQPVRPNVDVPLAPTPSAGPFPITGASWGQAASGGPLADFAAAMRQRSRTEIREAYSSHIGQEYAQSMISAAAQDSPGAQSPQAASGQVSGRVTSVTASVGRIQAGTDVTSLSAGRTPVSSVNEPRRPPADRFQPHPQAYSYPEGIQRTPQQRQHWTTDDLLDPDAAWHARVGPTYEPPVSLRATYGFVVSALDSDGVASVRFNYDVPLDHSGNVTELATVVLFFNGIMPRYAAYWSPMQLHRCFVSLRTANVYCGWLARIRNAEQLDSGSSLQVAERWLAEHPPKRDPHNELRGILFEDEYEAQPQAGETSHGG